MDIRRFPPFMSQSAFIKPRASETLGRQYKMVYPHEHSNSARGAALVPCDLPRFDPMRSLVMLLTPFRIRFPASHLDPVMPNETILLAIRERVLSTPD